MSESKEMTKAEALVKMREGVRIRHESFDDHEWMTFEGRMIMTEEGYYHDPEIFWRMDRNTPSWDRGYYEFKEKPVEGLYIGFENIPVISETCFRKYVRIALLHKKKLEKYESPTKIEARSINTTALAVETNSSINVIKGIINGGVLKRTTRITIAGKTFAGKRALLNTHKYFGILVEIWIIPDYIPEYRVTYVPSENSNKCNSCVSECCIKPSARRSWNYREYGRNHSCTASRV